MQSESRPPFLPALEGIRGYAFLVVFYVHYICTWQCKKPLYVFSQQSATALGLATVPLFFALSGYLITMIVRRSISRAGFFRVYFWRRALRILPAYYLILVLALGAALFQGAHLRPENLLLFIYAHNFSVTAVDIMHQNPTVVLGHLWSMAVEEQFYIVWPLVVWLVRSRVRLLWACYLGILGVNILRFCWPSLGFAPHLAYVLTATRADGLLMGCALALHRETGARWRWRMPLTWASLLVVVSALIIWRAHWIELDDPLSIQCMHPLANLLGLVLVVVALEEGSWLKRMCELRPARYLGEMSYGLYLFHLLYVNWFHGRVVSILFYRMPRLPAVLLSSGMALLVTLGLSVACFRWIEMPAMRLRERVVYGERRSRLAKVHVAKVEMGESTLSRLTRVFGAAPVT